MTKRPSFQFYPSDWRTSSKLRLVSLSARGLWIDMICIMHEGEPYGHLNVAGTKITAADLARLVGEAPNQIKRLLKELEEKQVFEIAADGTIFSSRMMRDEQSREERAATGRANGLKGGEYGHLGKEGGKKGGRPRDQNPEIGVINSPPNNPLNEPPEKPGQNPRPSSASPSASPSASAKEEYDTNVSPPEPVGVLPKSLFDEGLALLTAAGLPPPKARSMVGKWRKKSGDDETLAAIRAARDGGVSEPIEWISKRLDRTSQGLDALFRDAKRVSASP